MTRLLQLNYRHDLSETETLVNCLGGVTVNVCFGLLLFYIIQTRELQLFAELQKSTGREQQMATLLNSQTDSILVVEKAQTNGKKNRKPNSNEQDQQDSPRLKVAFSNIQSRELFGQDLCKTYSEAASIRYLEEPVLFALT